ncbi:hypothetical protein ACTQKJ_03975 [Eggerthellaceae bacterium PR-HUZ602407-17]
MNTKLLDTLKEKWTKKSTKIACASVGTVAVLGVVGALIACNLPHTEQVIAEDGTITTVQTPQKESHGLFDIFHAPAEQADAAQSTTTEIAPPQTNANATPINTPTAAPGTPQAAASGSVDNVTGTAAAAPASESAAPAPAPAAVESSPAPAEESPEPAAPQEMPRTNVHGGVYMPNINCYKVIDQKGVPYNRGKSHERGGWITTDGKHFDTREEAREYSFSHKVGIGIDHRIIVDEPSSGGVPEIYHYETLEGKRISPNITGNVPA